MKTFGASLTFATVLIAGLCLIAPRALQSALAQPDLNFERERGRVMLRTIKDDLKKNYYDTGFHGMDVEARFSAAEAKMKEAASVMKPQKSKPHGGGNFKGKLVVLVDSKSGSAAEIFARVIQLEKRGAVIGDRTAGAVMQSRTFDHQIGMDTVIFYGASVTNADVIMSDGKSLEGVGVTPDELLLPTAADMAAKRDPVLTRAAATLGFELPPDKAGAMFPVEWRK